MIYLPIGATMGKDTTRLMEVNIKSLTSGFGLRAEFLSPIHNKLESTSAVSTCVVGGSPPPPPASGSANTVTLSPLTTNGVLEPASATADNLVVRSGAQTPSYRLVMTDPSYSAFSLSRVADANDSTACPTSLTVGITPNPSVDFSGSESNFSLCMGTTRQLYAGTVREYDPTLGYFNVPVVLACSSVLPTTLTILPKLSADPQYLRLASTFVTDTSAFVATYPGLALSVVVENVSALPVGGTLSGTLLGGTKRGWYYFAIVNLQS